MFALGASAATCVALLLAGPLSAAGDAGSAQAWRSAFEPRGTPDLGSRYVVMLAGPSLADRVAGADRPLSPNAQRRVVRQAEALQRRLLAALKRQGVMIRRNYSFARTLNGFSAVLDARALAALNRAPGVVGVYPVRAVYPATIATDTAPTSAALPAPTSLPGADGRGVTIAVLDTAVDAAHPALAGRVEDGLDATGRPASSGQSHGTRIAGIVAATAPGARILPIRVVGKGGGRSDVLLAGLERAVDPDGNGDVEDAAKVALAAVVEPYAAFADGPEARAVAGALELGTLVVAAAGNDGPGAAGFGTVGAPASAASALAVGAVDLRTQLPETTVTIRAGDQVVFEGVARLLGSVLPTPSTTGGAIVLPADGTPLEPRIRAAKAAGATVVLVYGSTLPAGALGVEEQTAIPVVAIPVEVGRSLAETAGERPVTIAFGPTSAQTNPGAARVAPFSSRGPAFDGRVKPDMVAPGVGIATADAGPTADGGPRYASVTGSSAAAAVAAGAAALVAQLRPELDASQLRAALVGSARPLAPAGLAEPVAAQGSGLVDPVAAATAELLVEPATLAFGRARTDGWGAAQTVRVTNAGGQLLQVHFEVVREAGAGSVLTFSADPAEIELVPGASAEVRIGVSSATPAVRPSAVSGWLVAAADGAEPARLPWTISFPSARPARLIGAARLSSESFAPSKTQPAVLSFRAGSAVEEADGIAIEPVAVLDVELWKPGGERLGVLLRLRDLLPGRYAIGLTGRDELGRLLQPGRYVVKLRARSVDLAEGRAGTTTVVALPFTLEAPR